MPCASDNEGFNYKTLSKALKGFFFTVSTGTTESLLDFDRANNKHFSSKS